MLYGCSPAIDFFCCLYSFVQPKDWQQWHVMLAILKGLLWLHSYCIVCITMPHWLHIHTHRHTGKPQPSRMFSDLICVATEVIAAWDARFDDLLFPTLRGWGRKVPHDDPAMVSAFPTRLASCMRPLYTAGIYLCLAALMHLNHGWGHMRHAVVSVLGGAFNVRSWKRACEFEINWYSVYDSKRNTVQHDGFSYLYISICLYVELGSHSALSCFCNWSHKTQLIHFVAVILLPLCTVTVNSSLPTPTGVSAFTWLI